MFSDWKYFTQKCISITQNTFQLQLQNTNYFCQGHKIQNTLNVFKIHVFQLLVFQLLQHCIRAWDWHGPKTAVAGDHVYPDNADNFFISFFKDFSELQHLCSLHVFRNYNGSLHRCGTGELYSTVINVMDCHSRGWGFKSTPTQKLGSGLSSKFGHDEYNDSIHCWWEDETARREFVTRPCISGLGKWSR